MKTLSAMLDEEGYLRDYHDWDQEVAQELARIEGINELTPERMHIVKFMREYYEKFEAYPILRYVCKSVHQPKECVNEEFIDPIKAWKIAGLPKPNPEVLAHLQR